MVRNRRLLGLKFRRQHPLSRFIADFYCHELNLVVEIDGNIHDLEHVKKNDELREKTIKEFGLKVLRYSNEDIFNNSFIIERAIKELL